MWYAQKTALTSRLISENFSDLSIYAFLARNAIVDNLDNKIHTVIAIVIKPLHSYGEYACQIEFYDVSAFFGRHAELNKKEKGTTRF